MPKLLLETILNQGLKLAQDDQSEIGLKLYGHLKKAAALHKVQKLLQDDLGEDIAEVAAALGMDIAQAPKQIRKRVPAPVQAGKEIPKPRAKPKHVANRRAYTGVLDEATVREIRASDESDRTWAELLECSRQTIADARTGRSWQHVK